MATLIQEPASVNPQTADWQGLLNRVRVVNGGLMLIDLRFSNNIVTLKAGSRFEINGSYYNTTVDESTQITTGNTVVYLYQQPNVNGTTTFLNSTTIPTFDIMKGGLFNGANRCIGFVITGAGGIVNNLVIASFNFMVGEGYYNPITLGVDGRVKFSIKALNSSFTPQEGDIWVS